MSTDGLMINDLGDHIALFMLFNPLTNYHYLMFQMGQGDGIMNNNGSFDIDLTFPYITDSTNDASVTTTIGTGNLTLNAATGSGQIGVGD
tara:strand:+ start:245 stop:514 length:270 start_codon:yes stop_codon:yes gene_type:complete